MHTNLTELVFILDRSGSMSGLESDTIGGFNSMLTKQQAEPGQCRITTVLFDNHYELLHDRIDIKAVNPITSQQYYARGTTALFDAIGMTINKIDAVQNQTAEEYRAQKVLFMITTDGMENASQEFNREKVKALIEHHKEKNNWEFIFLGANIDAAEVAGSIGIGANRTQSFHNDSAGISLNFGSLSKVVKSYRSAPQSAPIDDNWNEEIKADFEKRSVKR